MAGKLQISIKLSLFKIQLITLFYVHYLLSLYKE